MKNPDNSDGVTTWIMDEAMAEAVDLIGEDFDLSTIPHAEIQALAEDLWVAWDKTEGEQSRAAHRPVHDHWFWRRGVEVRPITTNTRRGNQ